MAQASITITDDDDGLVSVACDFGDAVVEESKAHQMIHVLLNAVLTNAKTFKKIEDTAPELDSEPKVIIHPDNDNTH